MPEVEINVVTGASGFSGKYITRRLIAKGIKVISLTGHPDRESEFKDSITGAPYNFDHPDKLAESMRGASVLYNTYWIRFAQGDLTFEKAIQNTRTLINAADKAGIKRIVHISIANPSEDSPLPYYKGKATVENLITTSGLSYAILRPAVLFGDEGILINNIAYFLRHSPAFGIPGTGKYKMRPIFVEDLADLAVTQGQAGANVIMDAVGPESFAFDDVLKLMARAVGSRAILMHLPKQPRTARNECPRKSPG